MVSDHDRFSRCRTQGGKSLLNRQRVRLLLGKTVTTNDRLEMVVNAQSFQQRDRQFQWFIRDHTESLGRMPCEEFLNAGITAGIIDQVFSIDSKEPLQMLGPEMLFAISTFEQHGGPITDHAPDFGDTQRRVSQFSSEQVE